MIEGQCVSPTVRHLIRRETLQEVLDELYSHRLLDSMMIVQAMIDDLDCAWGRLRPRVLQKGEQGNE